MIRRLLAAVALLFAVAPARASENLVPSCYARHQVGLTPAAPQREIFVLVDQTTALDPELTRTLRANVARLVRSGTAFTVASFSAFRSGHFTQIIASGAIEPPVPANKRNGISVPKLRLLDRCLREQPVLGARIALAATARAQSASAAAFDRSEIMASLRQLSARVAASRARSKIVIIGSDMLEHSSATSFYAHQGLKLINPAVELRKALASGLAADFGGASIYVIGAGILPPRSRDAGRTIQALDALEMFWANYFRRSRARLVAFGRPNLLSPIQ